MWLLPCSPVPCLRYLGRDGRGVYAGAGIDRLVAATEEEPGQQGRWRVRDDLVLRVVGRLLIPAILLFALYVQFHGDFGPGGGFQAG